jgi:ubiquinone/menaquinone biosynthesis C-methylase UbiE
VRLGGPTVDVACGTGRHTAHLAALGHEVIGVDASPQMLAVARRKLPAVSFLLADLHRLPVADASVDLLVCALAATHVPDLRPVLAEFAGP